MNGTRNMVSRRRDFTTMTRQGSKLADRCPPLAQPRHDGWCYLVQVTSPWSADAEPAAQGRIVWLRAHRARTHGQRRGHESDDMPAKI
jgi:hypothetical protein